MFMGQLIGCVDIWVYYLFSYRHLFFCYMCFKFLIKKGKAVRLQATKPYVGGGGVEAYLHYFFN